MKCLSEYVCKICNDCMRDAAHLKSARCKDRTVPKNVRKKKRVVDPKGMKKVKAIDQRLEV